MVTVWFIIFLNGLGAVLYSKLESALSRSSLDLHRYGEHGRGDLMDRQTGATK